MRYCRNHHRSLGTGLLYGPTGVKFVMSKVPLYSRLVKCGGANDKATRGGQGRIPAPRTLTPRIATCRGKPGAGRAVFLHREPSDYEHGSKATNPAPRTSTPKPQSKYEAPMAGEFDWNPVRRVVLASIPVARLVECGPVNADA